jgi:hypothetical protein
MPDPGEVIAFVGTERLAVGSLDEVALAVDRAAARSVQPILIFDRTTGEQVEPAAPARPARRAAGRPRLGVVAREVTLLPRHWDWLADQPGGASVTLRRLVEQARRSSAGADRVRRAREAAYRFMTAMGGDRPGFEEALRALFAGDRTKFGKCVAAWPRDVREEAEALAGPSFTPRGR